jgi:tetratricopeptide (TPR) repeat protein
VEVVRSLCSGLAWFDDDTLVRLLREALDALSRDGRDRALDEGYVDGVARYLRDPAAYGLPSRRRPRAAAVLRALVPRIAPRLSDLDADALAAVSEQAAADGLIVEAETAYRGALAVLDVEDALRTEARRAWERGKLSVLVAQRRAATGDAAAALAALAEVRAPDPESDELAYLHGYGLVKVGGAPAAARAALEFAHARNPRYAPAAFYLAFVVESSLGPQQALNHYEHAAALDRAHVANAGASNKDTRDGRLHPWSHYPYYYARALCRAGLHDEATAPLVLAIRLDDRRCVQGARVAW